MHLMFTIEWTLSPVYATLFFSLELSLLVLGFVLETEHFARYGTCVVDVLMA